MAFALGSTKQCGAFGSYALGRTVRFGLLCCCFFLRNLVHGICECKPRLVLFVSLPSMDDGQPSCSFELIHTFHLKPLDMSHRPANLVPAQIRLPYLRAATANEASNRTRLADMPCIPPQSH